MVKSAKIVDKSIPASLWKRAFAYFIDIIAVNFVLSLPFRNYFGKFQNLNFVFGSVDPALFWLGIFFVIMIIFYFTILEYKLGQTLGKMVVNIYVVSSVGKELKLSQILIRNLLKPFPIVLLVDVLYMVFKGGNQRLFDLFSGTIVVEKEVSVK